MIVIEIQSPTFEFIFVVEELERRARVSELDKIV